MMMMLMILMVVRAIIHKQSVQGFDLVETFLLLLLVHVRWLSLLGSFFYEPFTFFLLMGC